MKARKNVQLELESADGSGRGFVSNDRFIEIVSLIHLAGGHVSFFKVDSNNRGYELHWWGTGEAVILETEPSPEAKTPDETVPF